MERIPRGIAHLLDELARLVVPFVALVNRFCAS
jgi:hypothetical protein